MADLFKLDLLHHLLSVIFDAKQKLVKRHLYLLPVSFTLMKFYNSA